MNVSEQNGWTDGMVFVGEWRVSCGCCPVTIRMDGRMAECEWRIKTTIYFIAFQVVKMYIQDEIYF